MASFEGKKDFTSAVEAAVEESNRVYQASGLEDAIAVLLPLEKAARSVNDFTSVQTVALHLIELCFRKADYEKLRAILTLLQKRCSQVRVVITAIVKDVMGRLSTLPDEDTRIAVIQSLTTVCDGQIYVEAESAALHFMLADIFEKRGALGDACDAIQDIHVETYGSLTKFQKANYILEQVRLSLLHKDFIRSVIHARKMNLKTIDENGFEEVRRRFYTMQVEYQTYEKNTWEISQAYYKIYQINDEAVLSAEDRRYAHEACVLFLLASKYTTEQQALLKSLKEEMDTKPECMLSQPFYETLNLFCTPELITYPFPHQSTLEAHPALTRFDSAIGVERGSVFIKDMRTRVVQHNARVIAGYYDEIRIDRLASLLNMDQFDAADPVGCLETHLSDMSFDGDLHVKIDQPARVVSFKVPRAPEEVLTTWSADINKLLVLMEDTCHLINRENMVHSNKTRK